MINPVISLYNKFICIQYFPTYTLYGVRDENEYNFWSFDVSRLKFLKIEKMYK